MPRSRKPRKRYVPAHLDLDPVETAIALASRLQPFQRASLRQPLRVALERLRTGAGDWPAWCAMADGMNVAEQLALRGIVSGPKALICIGHLGERGTATTTLTPERTSA